MAEQIGHGRCPCCGSSKARYTLSKSGLAVVTCNSCNFQGFARSERSDQHLRDLIQKQAEPVQAAIETAEVAATVQAAEPVQKKRGGWGLLGG